VTQAWEAFLVSGDGFFDTSKYYQVTVSPSIVDIDGTPGYLYTGSATSQGWFKLLP
jgi:hypothetical protein